MAEPEGESDKALIFENRKESARRRPFRKCIADLGTACESLFVECLAVVCNWLDRAATFRLGSIKALAVR